MTRSKADGLKVRWAEFKKEHPSTRIRDDAKQMGVSEVELLATGCGETVTRLAANWGELIKELPSLGYVMALTRNDYAVHEKKGIYQNISVQEKTALVLDENIDLRIFLSYWHYGFAVCEDTKQGLRRSLQFFDEAGTAIHKIYLTENSDLNAFEKLIKSYTSVDQSLEQIVVPYTDITTEKPDNEIDVAGFRAAWSALQDTHDFFAMLKKFGVTRTQALRLIGTQWAYALPTSSTQMLLEKAATDKTPIMVFVGSLGVIQIHTGPINKVFQANNWLNVLDPEFNLHINDTQIATAWVVKKPTVDGDVTSLEIYANNGDNIAFIFGKRKPGIPELPEWRELIKKLSNN